MYKVNEIFYVLQGEGFHTGTPATFVRFSGCNLRCSFCDTRHEDGVFLTADEILQEVTKNPARTVILTGGEPSLQIDENLVSALHKAGKYLCIETNGTGTLPPDIDWVTCSPKQGTKIVLTHIDELKVVYEGQDMKPYEQIPATHYFLQPCSCLNTEAVIDYVLHHPLWRLSLQTHKLINIR